MLYRIIVAAVALSWAILMTLFVRAEFFGGGEAFEVPVRHIADLVFRHCQESNLGIFAGDQRLGNLILTPRTAGDPPVRSVAIQGSLELGGGPTAQRWHWAGVARFAAGQPVSFNLAVRMRDPAFQIELAMGPEDDGITYRLRDGDRVVQEGTVPLGRSAATAGRPPTGSASPPSPPGLPGQVAAAGLAGPTGTAGAPSAAGSMSPGPGGSVIGLPLAGGSLPSLTGVWVPPTVTARKCRLRVRDETIEAYQLTVRQGDARLAEIFVSQLGQVLVARTTHGYRLAADDMMLDFR